MPHLFAAPAQPTHLVDLLDYPLIDMYARTDVTTLFTLDEKTLNGTCSSVVRSQLLTSTHKIYKVAFPALSHPQKLMLTYGAFNAV